MVGRSNVGKSSLINCLLGQQLATVSNTPGKTTLVNHFLVNRNWYLVDLPGYGYAKRSQTDRQAFQDLIELYLPARPNLMYVFVLVDSRHKPQENDLNALRGIGEAGLPLAVIFTKTDKLSQTELTQNIENYRQSLGEDWEELPPIFLTSSETKSGRDDLLKFISENNREFAEFQARQRPY